MSLLGLTRTSSTATHRAPQRTNPNASKHKARTVTSPEGQAHRKTKPARKTKPGAASLGRSRRRFLRMHLLALGLRAFGCIPQPDAPSSRVRGNSCCPSRSPPPTAERTRCRSTSSLQKISRELQLLKDLLPSAERNPKKKRSL